MLDTPAVPPQFTLDDPLAYLPRSKVVEYRKGQIIYSEAQHSSSIRLIVSGKVVVVRAAHTVNPVVIDIYQRDELFGESGLLDLPPRPEEATALQDSALMTWSTLEVEERILTQPRLGLALIQLLVQRNIDFTHRIESLAVDNTSRRLARSLTHFCERFGVSEEDGNLRMAALTHKQLAQYVGTSREIVTHYMNEFRSKGYLNYSRQNITLHRDALRDYLAVTGGQRASGAEALTMVSKGGE